MFGLYRAVTSRGGFIDRPHARKNLSMVEVFREMDNHYDGHTYTDIGTLLLNTYQKTFSEYEDEHPQDRNVVKCDKCDLMACKHHAGFANEAHLKRYERSKKKSWLCSNHGHLFHCKACGDPLDSCEPSRKIVITNPIGCDYQDAKGEYCSTWICLEKCAGKPADFDGTWYCDVHRGANI